MPARMSSLIVRAQGDATSVAASLRDAIIGVRPDLLRDVRTLSSQIDDSLFTERMLARISGFFGILALALMCIGLYGIVTQGVVRRIREIGTRIALGAAGGDIVRMVLRETLAVSVAGLAIGAPLAAGLTRLIGSFLYGVKANDPTVLGRAVLTLLAASALAAYLPARRAAKVDGVGALRHE
jgi:ABC-type antimicrobial peptide transport system permease subunit